MEGETERSALEKMTMSSTDLRSRRKKHPEGGSTIILSMYENGMYGAVAIYNVLAFYILHVACLANSRTVYCTYIQEFTVGI